MLVAISDLIQHSTYAPLWANDIHKHSHRNAFLLICTQLNRKLMEVPLLLGPVLDDGLPMDEIVDLPPA